METSQSVCVVTRSWFIMKIAWLVAYKVVFFLFFFVLLIFEIHYCKRWRTSFNVSRDWQRRYQNYVTGTILIYTSLTLDMFFRVFLLKVTLGFYKHSMCSVIKWCFRNWISLLNFELMTIICQQTRAFLIQNTFR